MMRITLITFFLILASCAQPSWSAGTIPSADTVTILVVGDSIAYGAGTNGGWRIALQEMLAADGLSFDFIGDNTANSAGMVDPDHVGYSGRRLDEIRTHVEGLADTPAPDYILVNVGTNDLDQRYELDTLNNRLDDFIAYMHTRWKRAQIIVATVGPFDTSYPRYAELPALAVPYNAHIMALTTAMPVDMAAHITNDDQLDGIHPNDGGYVIHARVWHGAIVKRLWFPMVVK